MKNKIKVGSILVDNDGYQIKILAITGLLYFTSMADEFKTPARTPYTIEELEEIFTLKEEKWIPEVGSRVFIPAPSNTDFYYVSDWDDDEADKMRLERGLVFRTQEQAIKKCKEMLSK